MEIVVEKIKKYLKEKGWTQKELAEAINVSVVTVNSILTNKQGIKVDMLDKIGKALEKPILYFLDDNISAIIDDDVNEINKENLNLREQLNKSEMIVDYLKSKSAASKEAFDIIMKLLVDNPNMTCKEVLPYLKSEKAIEYMTKYGLLNHKIFE